MTGKRVVEVKNERVIRQSPTLRTISGGTDVPEKRCRTIKGTTACIARKTENVDRECDRRVNGTLFRERERESARERSSSSFTPEAVQYPNGLIRRAAASSKLREWRDLFTGELA
ncbi:unnamed protein product [Lasius platythorax]|uniref:Uncharacterized protein n=1 Tax=Lasius platythorax TaxID=488582 RepID=A0AAV2PBX9_9HYME